MVIKRSCYLSLAIILTAIISASCHGLILHYFMAPQLIIPGGIHNGMPYVLRLAFVMASVYIFYCSKKFWQSMSIFYQIILFSILILALTGQFRWTLMSIIVGNPWQYQVLSSLPNFLSYFMMSLVICWFFQMNSIADKYRWLIYIFFIAVTTLLFILTTQLIGFLLHTLITHVPQPQPEDGILSPYPLKVLIPAYLSFIEPTIASFIVFYLIKDHFFQLTTLAKGLIMVCLIIMIHSGLLSIVQIIFSQGDLLYRIFYYGQFLWEYMALGLLSAYFVSLLTRVSLKSLSLEEVRNNQCLSKTNSK